MKGEVDYAGILLKTETAYAEIYASMLRKDSKSAKLYAAEVIRCMAHFIGWIEKHES